VQQPARVVEVEVAERDDVDRPRIEACVAERRQGRRPLVPAHRPRLLVDPLADPRLDEDPPGRRLDHQAVERLEEPVLGVDLVGDEAIPEEPRHGTEERARVRPERAGLDDRDMRSPAEIGAPVDRVVDRHARLLSGRSASPQRRPEGSARRSEGSAKRSECSECPERSERSARRRPASKSSWNADAVGSDWPWYFDPSPCEPYGRSTGLDIRKKLIWPIRMP